MARAKIPALLVRMSSRANDALESNAAKLEVLVIGIFQDTNISVTTAMIVSWRRELFGEERTETKEPPPTRVVLCSAIDELEDTLVLIEALKPAVLRSGASAIGELKKAEQTRKRLVKLISNLKRNELALYEPNETERAQVRALRRQRLCSDLSESKTLLVLLNGTFKRGTSSDFVHNYERKAQRRRIESVKAAISILEEQLRYALVGAPVDEREVHFSLPALKKLEVIDALDVMLRCHEEALLLQSERRSFIGACDSNASALQEAAEAIKRNVATQPSEINVLSAENLGQATGLLKLANEQRELSAEARATVLSVYPRSIAGTFARALFVAAQNLQSNGAASAIPACARDSGTLGVRGNGAGAMAESADADAVESVRAGKRRRGNDAENVKENRARSRSRSRSPTPPLRYPNHPKVGLEALAEAAAAAAPAAEAAGDGSSGDLKRALTPSEAAEVGAAWAFPEGSEAIVCSLPAGVGGSSVDILGKHMAR